MPDTIQLSRRSLLVAGAISTIAQPQMVSAQSPVKPITLVVPTPAGGTTDIVARLLAEPLGRLLGVAVTVENHPGNNGANAGQRVALGLTDGSTLLLQYSGFQCISPQVQPVTGYDPAKDLKPIAHLVDAPQLLAVRSGFPANNFADFLRYVRANPGKTTYASSGNGSLQHVTTELLKDLTKTIMVHIPYSGMGTAVADLLNGGVDFTITTPPPLVPQVRAGKLKALMVTGKTRLAVLPDVPTALESGISLIASSWFALYGANGISEQMTSRIATATRQAISTDNYKKRIEEQGANVLFLDASELNNLQISERRMWSRILRLAGIKST